MRSVGVAISVYPEAVGHFVPEQLPKILLLNRTLPAGVPILAIESRTSSRCPRLTLPPPPPAVWHGARGSFI